MCGPGGSGSGQRGGQLVKPTTRDKEDARVCPNQERMSTGNESGERAAAHRDLSHDSLNNTPVKAVRKFISKGLAYEILLYLNSFYLGMFIVCETAMGILKVINVTYPEDTLPTEVGIFCALCLIETLRIFLGRRGNLASKKIAVVFSVLLTIPSAVAVCYFLICQTYILRLEYIWCLVMLLFHALELAFAILYLFTVCQAKKYD